MHAEAQARMGSDATLALPEPLHIEQVLKLARSRRAEVVAARERARAASERPAIVAALEEPVVSASVDHLPFMLNGADVSLSVEQRFPLSKVRGNLRRAAEAEATRLRSDTGRVGLDVEWEAANSFLMLYERRQTANILIEQLGLAHELVGATTARYASGNGLQADVLRAELEVARLEAAQLSLKSEIRGAEAMLNASLARDTRAPIPELASAAITTQPPEFVSARDAALGSRPEVASGRAEIAKAEADVAVMNSMYSPMAMLRTGPSYTMSDGPGWMLMVGVSVPIWRDRLSSGVREAEAMLGMSRADLSAMKRMIEGEVANSRYQLLSVRDRYLALRDQLRPRAKRMIETALTSYSTGTLPLVSVIEAVQSTWSVEMDFVTAEYELGLSWARFRRAIAARTWGKHE